MSLVFGIGVLIILIVLCVVTELDHRRQGVMSDADVSQRLGYFYTEDEQ